MRAFLKTLFGDAHNVAVVALLLAVALALTCTGHPHAAAYILPPLTLLGVAWLAPR